MKSSNSWGRLGSVQTRYMPILPPTPHETWRYRELAANPGAGSATKWVGSRSLSTHRWRVTSRYRRQWTRATLGSESPVGPRRQFQVVNRTVRRVLSRRANGAGSPPRLWRVSPYPHHAPGRHSLFPRYNSVPFVCEFLSREEKNISAPAIV